MHALLEGSGLRPRGKVEGGLPVVGVVAGAHEGRAQLRADLLQVGERDGGGEVVDGEGRGRGWGCGCSRESVLAPGGREGRGVPLGT
jgi:hypothetical protein